MLFLWSTYLFKEDMPSFPPYLPNLCLKGSLRQKEANRETEPLNSQENESNVASDQLTRLRQEHQEYDEFRVVYGGESSKSKTSVSNASTPVETLQQQVVYSRFLTTMLEDCLIDQKIKREENQLDVQMAQLLLDLKTQDCTKFHELTEQSDVQSGMDIIEKMDPRSFTEYLSKYGNTICGRHPIGVLLQVLFNNLSSYR
ncbi:unnamed protein product, partial [Leptidea sinapis]